MRLLLVILIWGGIYWGTIRMSGAPKNTGWHKYLPLSIAISISLTCLYLSIACLSVWGVYMAYPLVLKLSMLAEIIFILILAISAVVNRHWIYAGYCVLIIIGIGIACFETCHVGNSMLSYYINGATSIL